MGAVAVRGALCFGFARDASAWLLVAVARDLLSACELDDTAGFVVPACESCGGILKPHVVFFGENVPAPTVARCFEAVDALVENDGALLVAGSSLTVMSGFRFVRRAARAGVPVVIVNRGTTRADDLATYKLDAGVGPWLTELADAVSPGALTAR